MSRDRDDRMPRDIEVLDAVMSERDLTVAALSARSGLAQKSIYKYLAGDRTLPSDVLRAAFELTGDLRLLALVSGCRPIVCMHHVHSADAGPNGAASDGRIPPLPQLLPQTCEAVERCAASLKYMATIVQDNRVDGSDVQAIANFKRDAAAAMERLALAVAGIDFHQRKAGV